MPEGSLLLPVDFGGDFAERGVRDLGEFFCREREDRVFYRGREEVQRHELAYASRAHVEPYGSLFEVLDAAFVKEAADLMGKDEVAHDGRFFLNGDLFVPAILGLIAFEVSVDFKRFFDSIDGYPEFSLGVVVFDTLKERLESFTFLFRKKAVPDR